MEIRGLENIATEIIKKEGNYALYRSRRRGSQSGICCGGGISGGGTAVGKRSNIAKGKLCWNREIWKMYR